jgi:nicotinamidase-related amidase
MAQHPVYLYVLCLCCSAASGFTYERLNTSNCAVLFVDHQTGLAQLVRDYDVDTFKTSVLALVDIAKVYKLPSVITSSIRETLPDAPYIPRPGQINAWDNEDFRKAVKVPAAHTAAFCGI